MKESEKDAATILRELVEADKAWTALHPVRRISGQFYAVECRLRAAWAAARSYCGDTIAGLPIKVDPALPAGTIEARDNCGNVLARIDTLSGD